MHNLQLVGTYGFLISCAAFVVLAVLLIVSWKGQTPRVFLLAAVGCSIIWTLISASFLAFENVSSDVLLASEFCRSASWCAFLIHILSIQSNPEKNQSNHATHLYYGLLLGLGALTLGWPWLQPLLELPRVYHNGLSLFGWVAMAIVGLLLIEQFYRNASLANRWAIKHLCIGLGGLFAYDFYLYSDALLFKQINPALWDARGLINAFAVPLIAISAARNKDWDLNIHVSRTVVFHSATLVGSGIYLTVMAGMGYLIKLYGGTWGGVLQIGFLFGAGILLIVLLFSGKIRAKARVFLSKHFFSYRYDYREEWLRFTQTLADSGDNVPDSSIRAIATLVDSPGGLLWLVDAQHRFDLISHLNTPEPATLPASACQQLSEYFKQSPWIIDLDEFRVEPDRYESLELDDAFLNLKDAWLLIPVQFKNELLAVLMLTQSQSRHRINWEDRDLLKMCSAQIAVHLSQYTTNQALMESRQFDAFNRLSAYIVHDLKNILGQQSLLVANAEKHKHKPAFIDDVIHTLQNSVTRMTALMDQLRTGVAQEQASKTDLGRCVREAIALQQQRQPKPEFTTSDAIVHVDADPKKLIRVIGHLLQNAQEATPGDGRIQVHLSADPEWATIQVQDSGSGMNAEFIQQRLFKPFESTKGLTGMGIGVFESREYLRSIGGDLTVTSEVGGGSTFTIRVPAHPTAGDF